MSNENAKDLLSIVDAVLYTFRPNRYKSAKRLDRVAAATELSNKRGLAVANFSLGMRTLGVLEIFKSGTQ